MTVHTNTRNSLVADDLVAGDGYHVRVFSGRYEFTTYASNYGSGAGITLSRLMPDGTTKVQLVSMTSAGGAVVDLFDGTVQVDVTSDVVGQQVVFGRVR